jgi:hypothetical protein
MGLTALVGYLFNVSIGWSSNESIDSFIVF